MYIACRLPTCSSGEIKVKQASLAMPDVSQACLHGWWELANGQLKKQCHVTSSGTLTNAFINHSLPACRPVFYLILQRIFEQFELMYDTIGVGAVQQSWWWCMRRRPTCMTSTGSVLSFMNYILSQTELSAVSDANNVYNVKASILPLTGTRLTLRLMLMWFLPAALSAS